MGRAWPLTGRAAELQAIDAAMRRADGPQGVILAGAAGVGKTRLAREALDRVGRRGATVRWAAATASAQGLPLGAFAGLTGALGDDPAGLLPRAVDALLAGAGRAGVVVAVDDGHLLDELSASLLHQLVLRRVAPVVVTVRAGEPAPDAVTSLWKDGHLDRLDIRPLTESQTATLLEAVLGGPVDTAGAARLCALSGGNALYLRQLVDGEVAAGALQQIRGVWRWEGSAHVTPSLAELVDARMGRLSDPVRDVLDVLAFGEPLGVPMLVELTDARAVEHAENAALITVDADRRRLQARLSHPLYGETRRARMGQLRARRLRAQIASALKATGSRRVDDTLRRAVLTLDSTLPPDPGLFTAAARAAIALLDVPLAERLAWAAVEAGGGVEARVTLVYALSWLGRGEDADAVLAGLVDPAAAEPPHPMLTVLRAANLFFSCQRPADGEALLDRALAASESPEVRCALLATRAVFLAYAGRPVEASAAASEALSSAPLPDQLLFMANWGLVGGLGLSGEVAGVREPASRGYAVAARSFDAVVPGWGLADMHMCVLRLAGHVREAADVARARQGSQDVPGPLQLLGVALRGYAALYQGQVRTAIRLLREAEAGLGDVRAQGPGFRNLIGLTQALAMAGEVAEARKTWAELERERHPGWAFLEPEVLLCGAWVAAAEGAVSEAILHAHAAADLAAARGQLGHEVLALHTAVRFGDRSTADRLARLAARIDGPRATTAAAQAAALSADDGDALLAASEALEEMGDLLAAADASAQAAAAIERSGRVSAGRAAGVRAHRLSEACEGARTPALAVAARPLPLTDREREIVTLAAHGLSNRQIADRLVVSVRTVEGHLYRAGIKLGVGERAEFARLLRID